MAKVATTLPNERLRSERQRRGWSREYVAEQIGVADPKTIGRWERGCAFPSAYFLQNICALFAMLPHELGLLRSETQAYQPSKQIATRGQNMSKPENMASFVQELAAFTTGIERNELLDVLTDLATQEQIAPPATFKQGAHMLQFLHNGVLVIVLPFHES